MRNPQKKALVIGIDKYKNSSWNLNGCVADAMGASAYLQDGCGFARDNIRLVTNDRATKRNIEQRLEWLIQDAAAGDVLVFYYAGHGSQVRDRNGDELTDRMDEILCVAEDTIMLMDNGYIPAKQVFESVVAGHEVNTWDGNRVISASSSEKVTCTTIETQSGFSLKCGEEHPVAVFSSGNVVYKAASTVCEGDALLVKRGSMSCESIDPIWYLIGLFVGDGHFLRKNTIRFAVRKDLQFWEGTISELACYFKDMDVSYSFNTRNDFVITLKSSIFCSILKELGFVAGKRKSGCMPSFTVPSSPSSIKGFLRGIFDSDGCGQEKLVTLTMKDEYVVKLVKVLLQEFGIVSTTYRTSIGYMRLDIHNTMASKFVDTIGFGINRKNTVVYSEPGVASGKSGKYDISEFVALCKRWNMKIDAISQALGVHPRNTGWYHSERVNHTQMQRIITEVIPARMRDITLFLGSNKKDTLRASIGASINAVEYTTGLNKYTAYSRIQRGECEFLTKFATTQYSELAEYANRDWNILDTYEIDIVTRVDTCSEYCEMYDFTIESSHVYTANGVLVHNCPHDLDWDDPLTDDILNSYFTRVPETAVLVVILDCCNSGTGTRVLRSSQSKIRYITPPVDIQHRSRSLDLATRQIGTCVIKENHILMSACNSEQVAEEITINTVVRGVFSYSLAKVLQENNYDITYGDLMNRVGARLNEGGFKQTPQLECRVGQESEKVFVNTVSTP